MGVDEGGWGEREERELGDLEGQWGKGGGGRREGRGMGEIVRSRRLRSRE